MIQQHQHRVDLLKEEPYIYLFQGYDQPPQRLVISTAKMTHPHSLWERFWHWLTVDLYTQITEDGYLAISLK